MSCFVDALDGGGLGLFFLWVAGDDSDLPPINKVDSLLFVNERRGVQR